MILDYEKKTPGPIAEKERRKLERLAIEKLAVDFNLLAYKTRVLSPVITWKKRA